MRSGSGEKKNWSRLAGKFAVAFDVSELGEYQAVFGPFDGVIGVWKDTAARHRRAGAPPHGSREISVGPSSAS